MSPPCWFFMALSNALHPPVASAVAIAGVIATAGAAMFPFLMPSSSEPRSSLTIWDSTSSQFTLGLMFWAAVIFMPIVVFTRGGHTA